MAGRKHRRNRRRRKRKAYAARALFAVIIILIVLVAVFFSRAVIRYVSDKKKPDVAAAEREVRGRVIPVRPPIDVELLDVNPYSRPGIAMDEVKGIVVHYTANPGTGAKQNRDYFEGLKDSHLTYASSHFVIDQDGTIVQCIPTSEISYASNGRNTDTISIECCYNNANGSFEKATYDALVYLCAWLSGKFSLDPATDIIRHYDVTGKLCPKYYVDHEDKWEAFRYDVLRYLEKNGVEADAGEGLQEDS